MDELRQFLRTQTRAAHERTETAFAPFDLKTRGGYVAFLLAQARAILPMEAALDAFGRATFSDWALRCRAPDLAADLATLGVAPPAGLEPPELDGEAERFGAVYVLEGSHMGAKMLLKRLVTKGDPSCHGATRFLRHGQGLALWQGFLAELAKAGSRISSIDAANGALKTFAFFEAAANTHSAISEEEAA